MAMRAFGGMIIVVLVAFRTDPAVAEEVCSPFALNALQGSIVEVVTHPGSHATGVVLDKDRVVTVAHALAVGAEIRVWIKGSQQRATLEAIHEGYDLAILHVNTEDSPPIPLSLDQLFVQEPVWVLGQGKISEGKFLRNKVTGIVTSAMIAGGDSGAALLHCGRAGYEVSGIVHSYLGRLQPDGIENLGFSVSVPAQAVRNFLFPKRL